MQQSIQAAVKQTREEMEKGFKNFKENTVKDLQEQVKIAIGIEQEKFITLENRINELLKQMPR